MDAIALLLVGLGALLAGLWLGSRGRHGSTGDAARATRPDYVKGINYLLNEQPDKAIDAFIEVLGVDDDTVETHLALGNLHRRRGEVDRAIRIHQNLVARDTLSDEQRQESLLELAQDYLSAGLLDRAEDLFQELVESAAHRVQALRQLIDIYEQESDWLRCIDCARRLEQVTGNQLGTVIAHYQCERAEECRRQGDDAAALRLVVQALDTHRACVRASLLEADICMQQKDFERALRALQRVEDQDPDYLPETVSPLFECYRGLGREEECERYLTRMVERYGWSSATLKLAELKRERQGSAAAIKLLARMLTQRASVRGLDRLLDYELEVREGSTADYIGNLKRLTSGLLAERPNYKCNHCGFPAKGIHWQCPSCKHWSTVRPIQGLQGE